MEIKVVSGDIARIEAGAIIVNFFKGMEHPEGDTAIIDRALDGAISQLISQGEIKGKPNEVTIGAFVSDPSGLSRVLLTYRVVDSDRDRVGDWLALFMNQTTDRTYRATVGGEELEKSLAPPIIRYTTEPPAPSTLEYYIQALDGLRNGSKSPTGTVMVEYCR